MRDSIRPCQWDSFWTAHAGFWIAYLVIVYLALLPVSPLSPGQLFLNKMAWALSGAVVSLPLRLLYHRVLHAGPPLFAAGLSVAASATMASCWFFGYSMLTGWPYRAALPPLGVMFATYAGLFSALLVWSLGFVIVSLWRAAALDRWARADAERSRREAELEALRHPLNSHFLFNALTSIRALVSEDSDRARSAITQLAELLRDSLHVSARDEVTLETELRAGRQYLELEQVRFEEKLRVTVDVDASAHERLVPVFSLRAMIENAVKHGRPVNGILDVGVRVRRDTLGRLSIVVTNTGSLETGAAPGTSVGLRNLRERLERLYPGSHSLSLTACGDVVTAELSLADDAIRR